MANAIQKRRSRVFLASDHPLVRAHLAALLEQEADLEVCCEAAGPTSLPLIRRQEPDLVILDISLRRSHGPELLRDLKALQPNLPVLVLSVHDETLYAERALRAGARGYLTKEEATSNVLLAVRQVLAGQVYLSERMAGRLRQKNAAEGATEAGSPLEMLTEREWEVFQMFGRGLATGQIAEKLRLPIKMVESYRKRIEEKLQLADGGQLQQRAIQWVLESESRTPGSAAKANGQGAGATQSEAGEPSDRRASSSQKTPSPLEQTGSTQRTSP